MPYLRRLNETILPLASV